jgi:hypothetical protein
MDMGAYVNWLAHTADAAALQAVSEAVSRGQSRLDCAKFTAKLAASVPGAVCVEYHCSQADYIAEWSATVIVGGQVFKVGQELCDPTSDDETHWAHKAGAGLLDEGLEYDGADPEDVACARSIIFAFDRWDGH